jgi:hypothetical protein
VNLCVLCGENFVLTHSQFLADGRALLAEAICIFNLMVFWIVPAQPCQASTQSPTPEGERKSPVESGYQYCGAQSSFQIVGPSWQFVRHGEEYQPE